MDNNIDQEEDQRLVKIKTKRKGRPKGLKSEATEVLLKANREGMKVKSTKKKIKKVADKAKVVETIQEKIESGAPLEEVKAVLDDEVFAHKYSFLSNQLREQTTAHIRFTREKEYYKAGLNYSEIPAEVRADGAVEAVEESNNDQDVQVQPVVGITDLFRVQGVFYI